MFLYPEHTCSDANEHQPNTLDAPAFELLQQTVYLAEDGTTAVVHRIAAKNYTNRINSQTPHVPITTAGAMTATHPPWKQQEIGENLSPRAMHTNNGATTTPPPPTHQVQDAPT